MRRAVTSSTITRLAVFWTLLLALASGSLFAPGTMATRAADGSLVIELCTPDGVSQIVVGPDGQPAPAPAKPDDHPDPACAWAQSQTAQGWTAGPVPDPIAPRTRATAQVLHVSAPALSQLVTKTTQSQAPPTLL